MGKGMRWEALVKILLALALGLAGVASPRVIAAYAAQIVTTTVADTVYHADGTAAAGTVIVNWPTFTTMAGEVIQGGSQSTAIGTDGALSLSLVPNVGATPMGTYYTVVYHLDDGSVQKEYWVVPVSTGSVSIAAVKNTVLPTSVAMQTVSKSYVDTAIAAAVTGHPLDSTPYVLKGGDTMTGPLVLPADPVSANQAADKHYVDASVAGVSGAGGGKVALVPSATQVVTQPAGTDLEVNRLNGVEYASQYATVPNTNGIAGATTSSDCTSAGAGGLGCVVTVEPTVSAAENYAAMTGWANQTVVHDQRQGGQHDSYLNPKNPGNANNESAQGIYVTSTDSTQALAQATGAQIVFENALEVKQTAMAGGSNLYSAELGSVPYFKTTYQGEQVVGTYNTQGQHVLSSVETFCYAVGDCLVGSQTLHSMGGFRDNADEGTHPFDIQVLEDARVYGGVCSTGCTTGSQSLTVGSQTNGGTQGDGRYLIDKNPAKVISTGLLTGGTQGGIHATATFSGSSFPLSTFFQTAALIPSQARNIAPGMVSVAISTTGVPSGFSTNTAAAPGSSGVACVSAESSTLENWEMAPYTVVDGTHFQMTLLKPHGAGSTIAIGGLCGYGLEQTVDTENGIRQVFPVVGSYSSTGLYYAGALTTIVGRMGLTSAYTNLSYPVISATRSGNVVTLTISGSNGTDLTGLAMTVAGVTDSSYNGTYTMTSTGASTLTYTETGVNSTSAGGTVSFLTGGYALYPMAEVLSVYNASTKSVDGTFTLAPNTVAWAASDAVEEPHYFQTKVGGDETFVSQSMPRPGITQTAGYTYEDNVGPEVHGFTIQNLTPASNYFGNGGTHGFPNVAYQAAGIWLRSFEAQAGEEAAFAFHCNSKGCNRWSSSYNLFELDSSAGVDTINYAPQTSSLAITLRGTGYSFTPLAFTAGTANITTLNATTVNAGSISMGAVTSTSESTGALTAASVASTGALSGSSLTTGAITATSEMLTGTATSAAVNTGVVTATTLNGALSAANVTSGTLSAARLPVMGASGGSHAVGAVPDPGGTAGTTRYLREDGTWVSPAGGVTAFNSRTGAIVPASGDYGVGQVTGAAPLASPALTGAPTAPTQTALDNSTKVATTAYADGAVAVEKSRGLAAESALTSLIGYGVPTAYTGVNMELPLTDASGSTAADVSGANACSGAPCNATLGLSGANLPAWYSYGLNFLDTGTATTPYAVLTTPLSSWGMVSMYHCTPQLVTTTGIGTGGNPANQYPTLMSKSAGTGGFMMLTNNVTFSTYNSVQPNFYGAGGTVATDSYGGCHVYGFSVGSTGVNLDHILVDGVEVNYASQGRSAAYVAITGGTWVFGGAPAGGSPALNGLRGVIGYVMTHPLSQVNTMTDAQVVAALQQDAIYVAFKMSRRPTLPRYPQSTSLRTPQLNVIGDSIPAGYESTAPYSTLLSLNNSYTINNASVGGITARDTCKMADQRWKQYTVTGQTTTIFHMSTNDTAFGDTAADAFGSVMECMSKAVALKHRVFLVSVISRTGFDTQKNAINALYRSTAVNTPGVTLIDLAETPMGADGANTGACFNTDHVHPISTGTCGSYAGTSYAGVPLEAAVISGAINAADGSTVTNPTVTASNAFAETAANVYTVQTPTAAATHSLWDCQGQALARTVNNQSGFAITVSGINAETITGSATVAAGAIGVFTPELTSASGGGCYWLRTQ